MSNTLGSVCFAGAVVTPAEFQLALDTRRKAKPKTAPERPLSDAEIRARIAALTAENAHLRGRVEQQRNKEAERMAQEIIQSRQPAPKHSALSNRNRDRYY